VWKDDLARSVESRLKAWAQGAFGFEVPVFAQNAPSVDKGDLAFPFPLKLAGRLKRPPLEIAAEAAAALEGVPGIAQAVPAPPGFLNIFLDRSAALAALPSWSPAINAQGRKVIVEHTNINPNKAAHIGHLRNAVLGDALVRLLRHQGHTVEVQNYIDNTGVQVADVVVGLLHLDRRPWSEIVAAHPKLDFFTWDLYVRTAAFYEEDKGRLELRQRTLKHIEEGIDPEASLAASVASAMVRCHLATMERLGIRYDLLPKESEVLSYALWEKAFTLLKERGAVALAAEGKNAGCWVLALKESAVCKKMQDPDKILVRSNGTVTYTGKDIAYQMWKFGLLGTDFAYRPFHRYADGTTVWETTPPPGEPGAPSFGAADIVYNVIDVRQSYLQEVVKEALAICGFKEQAAASVHFAYEMVSLSEKLAKALGAGDGGAVAMSGRKGIGVKADDLLDALEAAAGKEVESRHPDLPEANKRSLARAIAGGALKFFMLKFGKEKVIAFDMDEALNFEGDSGPYLQYSLVRAFAILRKLGEAGRETAVPAGALGSLPFPVPDDLWGFLMKLEDLDAQAAKAVSGLDPSTFAYYLLDTAAAFHAFYHHHPLLPEKDKALYRLRLFCLLRFIDTMRAGFGLLGLPVPERM
jgi:arginyl-tRNA synthetase